ncbi:MAG: carboxypeptidase-like regulatory domain-containing protein [Bacteroidales bacterium]|nr:carboxypeptidase-like regulatory domain-containing protein [Bacteroidales bacterium]
MRLKALFFPILLLVSFSVYAQTDQAQLPFSVSGTVVDADTGRPLQYVGVSFTGMRYATVTNSDGAFTLKSATEPESVDFTLLGYKTVRMVFPKDGTPLRVRMPKGDLTLDGALVIADPYSVLRRAIDRIKDNYPNKPELFDCFYRETVQKKNRFVYVSEAVSRMYKTSYYRGGTYGDRIAVDKSRMIESPDKRDTLAVKVVGGPVQAVILDIVKNDDLLTVKELSNYSLKMDLPATIGDRQQFAIRLIPMNDTPYPLYEGVIYIDRETYAFTRFDLNYDMRDKDKVTRSILISKPSGLRFTPGQVSIRYDYSLSDGVSRVSYVRSVIRFKCDWKKRLFRSEYTAISELVTTDRHSGDVEPISRKESFNGREVLSDKAARDYDPEFWKDYNIIEPTESLDKAIVPIVRKTARN